MAIPSFTSLVSTPLAYTGASFGLPPGSGGYFAVATGSFLEEAPTGWELLATAEDSSHGGHILFLSGVPGTAGSVWDIEVDAFNETVVTVMGFTWPVALHQFAYEIATNTTPGIVTTEPSYGVSGVAGGKMGRGGWNIDLPASLPAGTTVEGSGDWMLPGQSILGYEMPGSGPVASLTWEGATEDYGYYVTAFSLALLSLGPDLTVRIRQGGATVDVPALSVRKGGATVPIVRAAIRQGGATVPLV